MVKARSVGLVLPFYNEAAFLQDTLACLEQQTYAPDRVVLVNNGSTDRSVAIAEQFCQLHSDTAELVHESRAGKVYALQRGCAQLRTEWTATWDADTYYPEQYFARIQEILTSASPRVVAVMALGVSRDSDKRAEVVEERLRLHQRFPSKCFTGGFGQTFRTDVLRKVGGFDATIWPFVLMDHEIVHRVHKHGISRYDPALWCCPSERRSDRKRVRWNLLERTLYRHVPKPAEDWFFYSFLAKRFERRGLQHLNLRGQPWQNNP